MNRLIAVQIIISIMLCACTSAKEKESNIMIFDPTEIEYTDIKLSDIAAEVTYIQTDTTLLLPHFSRNILFGDDYIVLYTSEYGALKYDRRGKFITKVGGIGGGPGEYDQYAQLVVGEVKDKIFIRTFNNDILCYTLDGIFLNKIKLDSIPKYGIGHTISYFDNHIYLFGDILPEYKDPYMWLKVDMNGRIVSGKQDMNFKDVPNTGNWTYVFSTQTVSYNGESITYWNEYNDTVFQITKSSIKPLYIWAKGKYRMTTQMVQNRNFDFYIPMYVADTNKYVLIYMRKKTDTCDDPLFYFYEKRTGRIIGTQEPLIDDINGGPAIENIGSVFRLNGDDYLKVDFYPYELKDALLKSDTPKSKELAKTIDEEGNPVIMLIKLKK